MRRKITPPKIGDRRYKVRFAWRPITTDDGYRCWLAPVFETWEYGRYMTRLITPNAKSFGEIEVTGWHLIYTAAIHSEYDNVPRT